MRTERRTIFLLAAADALFIAGVIFADDNLRWGSLLGAGITTAALFALVTQYKPGPVMTELDNFGFPANPTEADRS